MIKFIDGFLNQITMYRLVFYCLLALLGFALVLSVFGLLPFSAFALILTTVILVGTSYITNEIFARVFKVPVNFESIFITGLILSLIITPISNLHDLVFLFLAGVLASSSKFILAINKKHIFNPAALSVALTAFAINSGASWWIGTFYMVIPSLFCGFLIVRKIKKWDLVFSFLVSAISVIFIASTLSGNLSLDLFKKIFSDSPILFFAFVMLTEPQTTPPTKIKQIIYGTLVGVGTFYIAPEMALLMGNIFSYIVSPKEKLILKLKDKLQLAQGTYDFLFGIEKKFAFLPGQYMEWTLGEKKPDTRGNRRYFTLASSPTEGNLRIGVKFYPNASSFKKTLALLKPGEEIVASQLSGEFTLPKDSNLKLCFIAGGIGITPFRSMIKYLIDTNEKGEIVLLYSSKEEKDFVYKDIFAKAQQSLGIKIVYVATDKVGFIDEAMIKKEVPDFTDRTFYISGPHSMIDTFESILKKMGVKNIKVDFFPGYA